jgi:hypothetical protein
MEHGADWWAWRWWVAKGAEARPIDVYVAAAAMACDVQDLEEGTAAARRPRGEAQWRCSACPRRSLERVCAVGRGSGSC